MTFKEAVTTPAPHPSNLASAGLSGSLPVAAHQEPLARNQRQERVPNKKIIRDLGLKVTNQRLVILDIVREGKAHFTAQDVFETVSVRAPEIGFATVYRFLRTLSEHKYVTEVRMGGMPARYEWAGKHHHDHLTCSACSKIVEFENAEIERLQERVAKEFGFHLTGHLLELYGVCPECRRKQNA
jgi:Fur family transcriptional regulator, ferric uptake regulator